MCASGAFFYGQRYTKASMGAYTGAYTEAIRSAPGTFGGTTVGRLFGTDGVRGVANADLTAELALGLSVAAAHVLAEAGTFEGHRPVAVVGRDPRASGEFLEAAVVAGLASAGVDVLRVGVLPTPAVAYLTGALGADLGVMLSASHNPMPDNGVKFFARGGHKLADDFEDRIEDTYAVARVRRALGPADRRRGRPGPGLPRGPRHLRRPPRRGAAEPARRAQGGHRRCARRRLPGLAGGVHPGRRRGGHHRHRPRRPEHQRRLRLDPPGAAARRGGASTAPTSASRTTATPTAAWRWTRPATEVDGDQILAVLALAMRESGSLRSNTVVGTVMSNLGFKLAMEREGIDLVQTAVGDRYVLEAMKGNGYALGGEQSGHVIVLDHATTGDGTLTGLLLAARVAATGRPLADLAAVMERLPQVLVNVPDVDRSRVGSEPELQRAVDEAERELGSDGRVLLRPSGTEPLVRVMVEAADIEHARTVAARLADVVKTTLG